MIVEGQVHGGIAQGVGQALLEHTVYDRDGQLVTGSFMDYCMPRAQDLPTLKVDMTTTKSPSNPLGIKGCGEAGAIAAPVAVKCTPMIGTEDVAMPAAAQGSLTGIAEGQRRTQGHRSNRDVRIRPASATVRRAAPWPEENQLSPAPPSVPTMKPGTGEASRRPVEGRGPVRIEMKGARSSGAMTRRAGVATSRW
jgi:hypothetical protein